MRARGEGSPALEEAIHEQSRDRFMVSQWEQSVLVSAASAWVQASGTPKSDAVSEMKSLVTMFSST